MWLRTYTVRKSGQEGKGARKRSLPCSCTNIFPDRQMQKSKEEREGASQTSLPAPSSSSYARNYERGTFLRRHPLVERLEKRFQVVKEANKLEYIKNV